MHIRAVALSSICLFSLGIFVPTPSALAVIGFEPPAVLNGTADTDDASAPDQDNELTFTTDGSKWIASWRTDHPFDGLGADFDLVFATSLDGGSTWSAPQGLNPEGTSDTGADSGVQIVKTVTADHWLAIWSSKEPFGANGVDQDIYFSRSTDDGATWGAATVLNGDAATDASIDEDRTPHLAGDGTGNWVAVWKQERNSIPDVQHKYAYSTDDGVTWSATADLGNATTMFHGLSQGLDVVYNGTDFVVVYGTTDDLSGTIGFDADLLVVTITNGGGFPVSAPAILNSLAATDSGGDANPTLAANGTDLVVIWESDEDFSGAGGDVDLAVATSSDGGASWSNQRVLKPGPFGADSGDDLGPSVATDGAGQWTVIWSSASDFGLRLRDDFDILFSTSLDNGLLWSDPIPVHHTAAKDKGEDETAMLATDGAGTWLSGWTSSDDEFFETIGTDQDILFARSSDDCPATPDPGCFVSGGPKGAIGIKQKPGKDQLKWTFAKGPTVDKASELGDPTAGTDYVACLYDDTDGLVSELDAPAGGNCFVDPCWEDARDGYKYANKYGAISGISMKAGPAPKTKIKLKAKAGFTSPGLPLNTPVTFQLHNSLGECFSAEYGAAIRNDSGLFKARP